MDMKLLCTIFIFVVTFLHLSSADNYPPHAHPGHAQPPSLGPLSSPNPSHGYTQGSLEPQECGARCAYRCSNTQYRKPCLFFCNKCCTKCLCVPSGTYGNKQTCPCYNNWKTKRGGPKCP